MPVAQRQELVQLSGPIASIRTPFLRDGELDVDGLKRYVSFCLEAEARALMLTYGDSLFSLLSDQEIGRVTRIVIDAVAGKRVVCAATGRWHTAATVSFARSCREWGADLLMVLPPDWGTSCTADSLVAHFAAVAQELPIMVVTNLFAERPLAFATEVTTRLLAEVPGIVAVKDDLLGDYGRRLALLAADRWAVIAGGQKKNHLSTLPFGSQAYLSTFITFQPAITHRYWNAVEKHDLRAARQVVEKYDMPFFDLVQQCVGGFDAALHGIYELQGVCGRWRRPPYHSLTEAQLAELRAGLTDLALL